LMYSKINLSIRFCCCQSVIFLSDQ
jgi:hypothetical protein